MVQTYKRINNKNLSKFHFQSQNLYKFQISNLVMNSEYDLAIRGINAKNETIEGIETVITFRTPNCWEMHDFNISVCRKSYYR